MLPFLAILTATAPAQTAPSDPFDAGASEAPLPDPVVGGSPASPGDWPAVAALSYNGFVACSGILVTPQWLVTAGHCSPMITEIYLDTTEIAAPGEVHTVDDFVEHPDSWSTFDVALVHLAEPTDVAPMPLALDCIVDGWIRADQQVEIVGFGATDTSGTQWATELNQATIPIDDPACSDEDRGCNADVMPDGELIAGGDGIDSCTGDSGAPLFLEANGRTWVAGFTSRAVPAPDPCGQGGIYVRADAIADWIEDVTGEVLPRPSCDGLNRPPSVGADPIGTLQNQPGETEVEVQDVDLDQSWTMELAEAPAHGLATVDGSRVGYLPHPNFVGTDAVHVRITDDGTPPESTVLVIPVTVHPGEPIGGCGCTPDPGAPSAAWLLLAALGWRRRR